MRRLTCRTMRGRGLTDPCSGTTGGSRRGGCGDLLGVSVTKIGARRDERGAWLPAFSAEGLTQAVHNNLRNLGLDVLDVVNPRIMVDTHGPAEESIEASFTALAELQRQGLVRHIVL